MSGIRSAPSTDDDNCQLSATQTYASGMKTATAGHACDSGERRAPAEQQRRSYIDSHFGDRTTRADSRPSLALSCQWPTYMTTAEAATMPAMMPATSGVVSGITGGGMDGDGGGGDGRGGGGDGPM